MILENSAKAIYHKQQSINYQLIKLHNKWFLIGFYSAKRGKKLLVTIEIFLFNSGIFVAKQGNLQVFLSFFVAFQVILMRSKTSKIVLKQDISTHRIFISFLYHYPIVLNSMDKTKQITSFLKPCGLAPKSPILLSRKPHTFSP